MNPSSPLRRHPLREAARRPGQVWITQNENLWEQAKKGAAAKGFLAKKTPAGFFERLEDASKAIGFFT